MPKALLQAHVFSRAPLHGPRAVRHGLGIFALAVFGLVLDSTAGISGQMVVGIACWWLMLYLVSRQSVAWRKTLIIGCAFACGAEILLSLVLGWYDYQFQNIPFFVPPGHILVFMLSPPLARILPVAVLPVIPWIVVIYGVYAGISGASTFDTLLAVVFLLAWRRKHSRSVYAVMLGVALSLELWGTWLGSWVWHSHMPYTGGLVTGNPPLLAGALYGLFDMFLMRLARRMHRRLGDVPAQQRVSAIALPDTIQPSLPQQRAI